MTSAVDHPLETGWLPGTPLGDTVVRRFLRNQIQLNDVIAAARSGRSRHTDDVAMSEAGAVTAFLNQAVLQRPLAGVADPVLDEIEAFYRHSCVLVSAWPTPELSSRGWQLVGHPTFVIRAAMPAPSCPDPLANGVVVRTVSTAADLATFEVILTDGYPLAPPDDGRPTMVSDLLDTDVTLRLAIVDGRPAAVGASHVAAGVVNLCMAATLPAARRRGAWAALAARRIADDATLPAAAITSDDSRPGFERMGFLPITRFTLWTRPRGD